MNVLYKDISNDDDDDYKIFTETFNIPFESTEQLKSCLESYRSSFWD